MALGCQARWPRVQNALRLSPSLPRPGAARGLCSSICASRPVRPSRNPRPTGVERSAIHPPPLGGKRGANVPPIGGAGACGISQTLRIIHAYRVPAGRTNRVCPVLTSASRAAIADRRQAVRVNSPGGKAERNPARCPSPSTHARTLSGVAPALLEHRRAVYGMAWARNDSGPG